MKTPINSKPSKLGRSPRINVFSLAAVLATSAATTFGQSFWSGGTSDFNNPASWSGPFIGNNDNCSNDSSSNNVVLIKPGDLVWTHGDTLAGQGNGTSGAYLQTGSTNVTGNTGGNWMRLGIGSGSVGYYTLSNGVVNVTGRTHIGESGTGYLEVDGGTYNANCIGQNPGICAGEGEIGPGTGTLTFTGGTINNTNGAETWFGESGGGGVGTGYLYMSGGTFNANNWFVFGRNGGTGIGVMTGGTINFTGSGQFLIGGGGPGSLTQSGGTINVQNQYLIPQSGGAGNVFSGTNILSGTAVVNAHDWIRVGLSSGYGELDISGNASITRDNGNDSGANFDIANGAFGTVNQNGGAVTNLAGQVWIGDNSVGTWNLNSGIANLGTVHLAQSSGGTGHLNMNGGSLIITELTQGAGNGAQVNFNGGTIFASTNNPSFIHDIGQVTIGSGGMTIDSQGFNLGISEELDDAGGGLTKNGLGVLTLSGPNGYGGDNIVNAGTLIVETVVGNSVNYSVADNAGLGVSVQSPGGQLNANNFNLGTAAGASLNFDLGNFGNPGSAPLNIIGAANINGTIVVNIADALPLAGEFPLIHFGGGLSGSASFVIGSLPIGVMANIVTNTGANTIDLNISSVNIPVWSGAAGGNWDIGLTKNWDNLGTTTPIFYNEGNPVQFDDSATGPTTVNLVADVHPVTIVFTNNSLPYTLVGSGEISGPVGLNVQGASTVAILNPSGNNFTGPVTVSGGKLMVTNLANGGLPSAIGASSANSTNLVLAGGTLSYSGPAISINRGYSVQNTNSGIDAESNLTLNGAVTATAFGGFIKTGPAQLTYTTVGVNTLSGANGNGAGYVAENGTVVFDGSAGSQINNILGGHLAVDGISSNATVILTNTVVNINGGNNADVGDIPNTTGTLIVNNGTTLNVSSWMILGNGNNATATVTLNGGTINLNTGMLLLGGAMGTTNTLNVNGGVLNQGGGNNFDIADASWNGAGARVGIVNQTGGSVNISSAGQVFVGNEPGATAVYNLSGGTLNVTNWLAVGRAGAVGTINMSGGVIYEGGGGGNLDIGTSAGIGGLTGSGYLNQTGGAITNTASQTWLGEGVTGEPAFGIWNMSGGTAQLGQLNVGQGGTGTNAVNISGTGAITCAGYVDLANGSNIANVNIGSVSQPGGSLTVNNDMGVADTGTATINMVAGGGGVLTVNGTMYLSRGSGTAKGTVNLNSGSTIVLNYLNNGYGFGNNTSTNPQAFNFNGGTLKANIGSPYFIQPFVTTVVQSGGAIIDDGGYAVTVLAALVNGGGGGGLTKQGSGTLYLNGLNTYTGATLVNAGTLGGSGAIVGPVTVASGATLQGDNGSGIGTFAISNTLTLSANSSTIMALTPTSNDQIVGLTGVSYAGSLVVSNASSTPLTVNSTFKLFNSAVAGTGNFSSVTVLPSGAGTFNPATGILTITSVGNFAFNPVTVSGGNLILTGAGGTPGSGYTLLSTTNLLTPLSVWTTNTLGTLDSAGAFSNAIPVNPAQPTQFFRVRMP